MVLGTKIAIVGTVAVSALLFAQNSSNKSLPADLLIRLWRTQSNVIAAQLAMERTVEAQAFREALSEKQKIDAEWAKFCGDKYQPGLDSNKDPVCVAKSEDHK